MVDHLKSDHPAPKQRFHGFECGKLYIQQFGIELNINFSNLKIIGNAVQIYFHYHPKTISSVSSDPVRVCMCKSGRHLCHESYADIKVYPGEMFALSLS